MKLTTRASTRTSAKTSTKALTRPDHRLLIAGNTVVAGALALAALGFTGAADARDNVTFSVGIGVPGVLVGATNAYPVYSQPRPVFVQPAPMYYQPAPVYYQQAPVYYSRPPVYVVPQPVYYGRPPGWYGRHHRRHDERRGGYYQQAPQNYGPGYGQVYYQR